MSASNSVYGLLRHPFRTAKRFVPLPALSRRFPPSIYSPPSSPLLETSNPITRSSTPPPPITSLDSIHEVATWLKSIVPPAEESELRIFGIRFERDLLDSYDGIRKVLGGLGMYDEGFLMAARMEVGETLRMFLLFGLISFSGQEEEMRSRAAVRIACKLQVEVIKNGALPQAGIDESISQILLDLTTLAFKYRTLGQRTLTSRFVFWNSLRVKHDHATLVKHIVDARSQLMPVHTSLIFYDKTVTGALVGLRKIYLSAEELFREDQLALRLSPLPPSPSHPENFVGRGELLSEIVTDLLGAQGTHSNLIILVAPAGMGKTTLALAAFHNDDVRAHFSHHHWIDCSSIKDGDEFQEQLFKVAAESGDGISKTEPWEDFKAHLSSRGSTLIILDHLLEDLSDVAQETIDRISSRNYNVTIMITTRFCPSLPRSRYFALPPLSASSSLDLFCKLSLRHSQDPELVGLIKLVDGHPLLIRLVALAASREVSLAPILARWEVLGPDGFATHDDNLRLEVAETFEGVTKRNEYDFLALLSLLAALPFGLTHTHLDALLEASTIEENAVEMLDFYGLGFKTTESHSKSFLNLPAPIARVLQLPGHPLPLSRIPRASTRSLALAYSKDAGSILLKYPPTVPKDFGNLIQVFSIALRDLVDSPDPTVRLEIDTALLSLVQHQGSNLPKVICCTSAQFDEFLEKVSSDPTWREH
ncbi:hypothetical protein P7C70_g1926, partial [Phenoliferia sp. Uapishka_3]